MRGSRDVHARGTHRRREAAVEWGEKERARGVERESERWRKRDRER